MRKAFFSILLGVAYLVSGVCLLIFSVNEHGPYSNAQTVVLHIVIPLLCVILVYEGLHSFYNAVLTAKKATHKKGYVTEEKERHARILAVKRLLELGMSRESLVMICSEEFVREAELSTTTPELRSD